jgi:hypothetical protein
MYADDAEVHCCKQVSADVKKKATNTCYTGQYEGMSIKTERLLKKAPEKNTASE